MFFSCELLQFGDNSGQIFHSKLGAERISFPGKIAGDVK